jgi:ABC-type bacteriocin/lantibiotic exporter with double-glycine peptidase domain
VLDLENEAAGVVETEYEALQADWGGLLILCGPRKPDAGLNVPFGFQWFLPSLKQHRTVLLEVLLVLSLKASLLSLRLMLKEKTSGA